MIIRRDGTFKTYDKVVTYAQMASPLAWQPGVVAGGGREASPQLFARFSSAGVSIPRVSALT